MTPCRLRYVFIALLISAFTWGCTSTEEPGGDTSDPTDPANGSGLNNDDPSDVTTDPELDYPNLASVYAKDRVLEVQVDIAQDDWNLLRFERRSMTEIFGENCEAGLGLGESPYNYYPSTITVDDTVLENVGIRTKGLLGSINPARPSLKVNLHRFIETDDIYFEETKRFTFNNQNQDDSRMRTCLAYYIFAAAGVPASLCNFAHISVNERDFGIYANVEGIKKPLLARVFGDDSGNLYEGTASDIRAGGFMSRIEKKTNEIEDDWSDIYQLRDAIEAPDESFRDAIEEILNIEAFINFWAAESLVGHWDGFSGNRNNYYTYHNPVDGKFHFIPWGPDGSFARTRGGFSAVDEGDPNTVMASAKLARRLWSEPDIQIRYQERMEELLEDVWNEEEIIAEISRIRTLIEGNIPSSQRDEFLGNINSLIEYVNTLKSDYSAEFAAGVPEFVSELPEDFSCMAPVGNLTINLTTTWGSAGADNPFNEGSGSMVGTYFDIDMDFQVLGVTAGNADGAADGDMASITSIAPASSTFDDFIVALINMPQWLIQPGATVPITGQAVSGFFVRFKPATGDFQLLGFIGGTQIQFGEQAGTNEGDVIDATIELEIWGGGGGGENYGTPAEPPDDLAGNPGGDDGDDGDP